VTSSLVVFEAAIRIKSMHLIKSCLTMILAFFRQLKLSNNYYNIIVVY